MTFDVCVLAGSWVSNGDNFNPLGVKVAVILQVVGVELFKSKRWRSKSGHTRSFHFGYQFFYLACASRLGKQGG